MFKTLGYLERLAGPSSAARAMLARPTPNHKATITTITPNLMASRLSSSSNQAHIQHPVGVSCGLGGTTTSKLELIEPSKWPQIPKYRVLGDDNELEDDLEASLDDSKLIELYEDMVRLNIMDTVLFECQRQGRISFYMTSFGEEAAQLGSAGALEPQDLVFAQYREAGVLIHRKMSFEQLIGQCLGNCDDLGKGRQMPVHYGNKSLNYVTISSTLTTQLPQAVGAAYALKRRPQSPESVVMCYFGEGAASEGDAHAAMNFAATLKCPVVFFCRNNGYAISTPAHEQYAGDGIVARAIGYGIGSIRVDGNDLMAVYGATKLARRIAATESRPVMIEAMTYRLGHHSTSDDSSAYRKSDELMQWKQPQLDPMARCRAFLERRKLWSEARDAETRATTRRQVLEALSSAERKPKLRVSSMFDDVYAELPSHLARQKAHLAAHLAARGQHYSLAEYQPE